MCIEILLNKLRSLSEEFRQCENKIKKEQMQTEEVYQELRKFQDDAMHELRIKLRRQIQGMESDLHKLEMLRTALLKVISLYENCEDKIVGLDEGKNTGDKGKFEPIGLQPYFEVIEKLDLQFVTYLLK